MKNIDLTLTYQELTFDELAPREQELVTLARVASQRAYAPYSKFQVGAAILLSNGEIVTGSNQENAAFPSGTCAERTAAFWAHSQYPKAAFKAIAVAAFNTSGREIEEPVAPCGAGRQVLLEFEKLAVDNVKVLLVGHNKIYVIDSVKSLLPFAFIDFE